VIDEVPVQVLDPPFDLAPVLRMRRTRKINLNMMFTASFLPLLLELAAIIGKNSLGSRFCFSHGAVISVFVNSWVKLLSTSLSTSFNAQICPHAALKAQQPAQPLKRSGQARWL
jgi:hypothetical protein